MKKALLFFLGLFAAGSFAAMNLISPSTGWARKSVSVVKGAVASQYGMVEGARVRIQGSRAFALSDKNGRFVLETPWVSSRPVTITAGKDGWFNNAVSVWP